MYFCLLCNERCASEASQTLQGKDDFFCFAIFFKTEDLGLEMHSGQHSVKPEKYLMDF